MKTSEMEKEAKDKAWEQVDRNAAALSGDSDWGGAIPPKKDFGQNHRTIVGICALCNYYQYAENNFHQIVHARCSCFDRDLGQNKIKDCSNYEERGRMTLNTMFAIATLITPQKDKIGF